MNVEVGWFGIPGGPSWRSTKTHAVVDGKPMCGSRLGKDMEFQWCSHHGNIVPECETCKRLIAKTWRSLR